MDKEQELKISEHLDQADRLHQAADWHLCSAALLALDAGTSLEDLVALAGEDNLNCLSTVQVGLREAFESLHKLRVEDGQGR